MSAILVVREADDFSRILAANGYEIINLPLIETKVSDDLSDFEKTLESIEIYDGVFITSAHAAQIFADKLREKRVRYSGNVYVLGKRGFDILKTGNLSLIYDELANTAREMLENIAPEDLRGKRFLFVRGEKSLKIVPKFLAEISEIDETIVYQTLNIEIEVDKIQKLREKFENRKIACVCFFSPSAAESFIKQFGTEILRQNFIAVIGKTTASFFEKQGLQVDFISPKATAKDFAADLLEYLRKRN